MKYTRLYILLLFTGICFTSRSQHISGAMNFSNSIEEKDNNSISFSYSNLFYLRDYEYFHNIQTGYTLFGTWQYPRITITPNKNLKLEAGVLLQKEFGDNDLNKVWPVFSLRWQKNNFYFNLGAFEGSQSHQLVEPLMQYDEVIERPIEEGVQFKINKKRFQLDTWLDWELRQKKDADYPEELTGGLSFSYTITRPGKAIQVKIPLQIIIPHKGGQLDTNSSVVSTTINHAKGIWVEWNNPDKKNWLQQLRMDGYHVGYYHSQDENVFAYNKGNGILINFFARSKWDVSLLASYWNGNKYIAPHGGKLFQSISSITGREDYKEPERQLLLLNLLYEKEVVPGFFIDLRYSPYIDLHNHFLEHSFLALFSYRKNFHLGYLKKQ
jgi:hypothetical protein